MIKPIIIAMMLFTGPLYAAQGPLLTKMTRLMGCEGAMRPELPPERAAVLAQVQNLAARITLLSDLVPPKQFNTMIGSTAEELDESLAQLATNLMELKPNAIKAEDIKESLQSLESRVMDNLSASQKEAVTVADIPVPQEAKPEVQVAPPQYTPNNFQSTPGWRSHGPPREKP